MSETTKAIQQLQQDARKALCGQLDELRRIYSTIDDVASEQDLDLAAVKLMLTREFRYCLDDMTRS